MRAYSTGAGYDFQSFSDNNGRSGITYVQLTGGYIGATGPTGPAPTFYLLEAYSNEVYLFARVLTVVIIFRLDVHAFTLGVNGLPNDLFLQIHRVPGQLNLLFIFMLGLNLWQFVIIINLLINRKIMNIFFLEHHHRSLSSDRWQYPRRRLLFNARAVL